MTRITAQTEKQLAEQIALYLQTQWTGAIYRFDLAAGMPLTIGQASYNRRLHPRRGFPDLVIYKARHGYFGLALELKREGEKVYLKNGITPRTPHIAEQFEFLKVLEAEGYKTHMVVGFEETRQVIDNYLG